MQIFTSLADFIAYGILGFSSSSQWGKGVHFFIEDISKIFFLLGVMIYLIGWLRASLPIEKIRSYLLGYPRFFGYFLAAFLGAITPFCSCSSIPLFLGFTAARIPFGITMAFLITSPMINEVAVIMLGDVVGWKLTAIYLVIGVLAGVFGGMLFDHIKADRFLTIEEPTKSCCCKCQCKEKQEITPSKFTWRMRHDFAIKEVIGIFTKIWLWVVMGIGIGSFLHGFVPDQFITQKLGGGQWWSVPCAVVIGIPTYANATGVIPIVGMLIQKGLPVGTAFAFMLSTVAVSLPEFIMLRKVMSLRLLLIFATYLLIFFTICGVLLNIVSLN